MSTLGRIKRGVAGWWQTRQEGMPPVPTTLQTHQLTFSVKQQPILYYSVGSGKEKVLIVAAIHGNEVGTVKLAYYLLSEIVARAKDYANLSFYILPCLNPDGYALARSHPDYWHDGRPGRTNAHGVDLNRNFDTPSFKSKAVWGHGKNYGEVTELFAGAQAGSEPEIAALMQFINDEKIEYYFALHSAGKDIMPNCDARAKKLATLFSQSTGYGLVDPADYEKTYTGSAKEWCEIHGIAYVEVEASTRWGSDWPAQKAGWLACFNLLNKEARAPHSRKN